MATTVADIDRQNSSWNSQTRVDNLPSEIIALIFEWGTISWQEDRFALPFPILASSVCAAWRQAAHSTPSLWTYIVVPLHKARETCIQWTSEWLARAKSLPFAVVIDDQIITQWGWHTTILKETVLEVFSLIYPRSQDLYNMDVHIINDVAMEEAGVNLTRSPCLRLRNLKLSFCGRRCGFSSDAQFWRWLLRLPNLTKLDVKGAMLPVCSNLTSLTARQLSIGYNQTRDLFQSSPALKELILHQLISSIPPAPHPNNVIPTELRSLQSLAVSFNAANNNHNQAYPFAWITMPNVTYLELRGPWMASSFGNSLAGAKLETIQLGNAFNASAGSEGPGKPNNIAFLQSFSTIRHLQLIQVPVQEILLQPKADARMQRVTRKRSLEAPRSSETRYRLSNLGPLSSSKSEPLSTMLWADLHTITLDVLRAQDVAQALEFVLAHRHIKTVQLSTTSARHLLTSLKRNGHAISPIPNMRPARFLEEEGERDVNSWIRQFVDIHVLQRPSIGLLPPTNEWSRPRPGHVMPT